LDNTHLVRFIRYFYITFVLVGIDNCVFAQGHASAGTNSAVSANITEPVGISKSVISNNASGARIISFIVETKPIGAHKTQGGSITLPIYTGVMTVAFFPISSFEGYTFTVLIPSSPLIIHAGTTEMQVISLTSEPVLGTDPDMIAGVFVSVSPLNVIVNYN
jgi:hypothetical protein